MRERYTADYLNTLHIKKRIENIAVYVDRVVEKILSAAENGKTGFIYEEKHWSYYTQGGARPVPVKPTMAELALAFQERFLNCKIELHDFWADVRPGVREQQCQIVIDWTPPGKAQDIGMLNTNAIPAQTVRL